MAKKHTFLIIAGLLLIASTAAVAGHYKGGGYHGGYHGCYHGGYHGGHHGAMPSVNMTDMDADKDGALSFDEYIDRHKKQLRAGFDMLDGNNDGRIDGGEWAKFLEVHGIKAQEM